MEEVILASSSQNRINLLQQVKIPFRTAIPNIRERIVQGQAVEEQVERLASEKIMAVVEGVPSNATKWLLGFDTVIEMDDRIIGKPADRDEAKEILTNLDLRGNRILLPEVMTDITKFSEKDEILFAVKEGELKVTRFSLN